jgi:twinkle protein
MKLQDHERLFNLIDQSVDVSKYADPPQDAHLIKPVASFAKDIETELFEDKSVRGMRLPWRTGVDELRLRPGEVTIWAGRKAHWKSFVTSQVALCLAEQKQKVCIASLEMPAHVTGARMVIQGTGTRLPSREQLGRFYDTSIDHLWLYSRMGKISAKHILAIARYCATELGIQHFILDNLTKVLSVSNEDSAKQQELINDICDIANDYKIHFHVVAHVRKSSFSDSDEKMPSIDDIRGSGSMSDQVDNVVMVWRNKPKENESLNNPPGSERKLIGESDLTLNVAKQRHGSWEGCIRLWKHPASMQFMLSDYAEPHIYF